MTESRANQPKQFKMALPFILLTFFSALGHSKFPRILKLHHVFKRYSSYAEWENFAYYPNGSPGRILCYTIFTIQVPFPAEFYNMLY